ncbi:MULTISPECIES: hypothetical protein [Pseudomonas]|uniref:RiboL-PSP-HEPN domain-containing protein n=1 Tax=Pseudomonas syringae pv. papulans TaxID=83963 RepID=A0A0P9Y844_PSESX|nr:MULTISPECIES: hypothetical protein [Pseudomonas]KPY29571.1 Uncharacterized protein ALO65_02243 [Pseudomonas syringae pv. papulans]KWS42651.1 hypothetical protein AL059_18235 [Pseudomonas syringae pv. papulans]MDH4601312.1 hypothetical protein [Pseudomonas syringae pv. papulans]MDH4622973.1 hypothetical protein [Pseudomonas syringae pv. papulans]OEC53289.1 hypothetical protein A7K61_21050 [Pseudomonas sp. AP42]
MSTDAEFEAIKSLTRVALPQSNAYLFRLGIALYGFASIASFMAEVSCHLDSTLNRTKLEEQMGGGLLNVFRQAVEKGALSNPDVSVPGHLAADLFQAMNAQRSDIIHAYPITNPEGEQILHRRKDSQGKYFEVTDVFLDSFSSRLHELTLQLYAIRKIVRPDLGD